MDGACFETPKAGKAWERGDQDADDVETPARHPVVARQGGAAAGTGEPLSITGYTNLALGSSVSLSDICIQLLPFTAHDKDLMSPTSEESSGSLRTAPSCIRIVGRLTLWAAGKSKHIP